MSTGTRALTRSMSQPGHDPHGYNPVNYQHHYHWAQSAFLISSTDTSMQLSMPNQLALSPPCLLKQGMITLLQ